MSDVHFSVSVVLGETVRVACGKHVSDRMFHTRTDKLVTCEKCRAAISRLPNNDDRTSRWKQAESMMNSASTLLSRDPHYDDNVIEDLSRALGRLRVRIRERERKGT